MIYFELFLKTALGFGVIMSIYFTRQSGFAFGVTAGALGGLAFGIIISAVLTIKHKRRTKALGISENVRARQKRTFTVDRDIDYLYGKSILVVSEIHGCRITKEDAIGKKIQAKTLANKDSYGDVISIELRAMGTDKTHVTISSVPKLFVTVIDYGNGYQNVETIAKLLKVSH